MFGNDQKDYPYGQIGSSVTSGNAAAPGAPSAGIGDTGVEYPGDGIAARELEAVEAARTDLLKGVYQQFAFSGFDPLFYGIHIITG